MSQDHGAMLRHLLQADPWRRQVLSAVRCLRLPDWAIGAGFVRTLVWDRAHGFTTATPLPDIDVLYFDAADPSPAQEAAIEARLSEAMPGLPWSVKNQARMHERNGDQPYADTEDALRYWLETATCVAVRLEASDAITVLAPHGLDDLFGLRSAPTPSGRRRYHEYIARMATKDWPRLWPRVAVEGL